MIIVAVVAGRANQKGTDKIMTASVFTPHIKLEHVISFSDAVFAFATFSFQINYYFLSRVTSILVKLAFLFIFYILTFPSRKFTGIRTSIFFVCLCPCVLKVRF